MSSSGATGALLDDLLCQRAVQTELFYFAEFHDDFKKQWLENFLGHEGLANYHGFAGLRVPAAQYLSEMFNSPPVEHEVKMSWGSRRAGGSKNNPYLDQQPKFNYYKETLQPQKICKGIMAIREQLRGEWVSDLPVMAEEDTNFLGALRRREEALGDQMDNLSGYALTRTLSGSEGAHAQPGSELRGGLVRPEDEEIEVEKLGFALVRDDMNSLGVREGSTPLRSQSYDVLKKAATYIAVQRLMAHWARDSKMEGALHWFTPRWEEGYRDGMAGDSGRHFAERFLTWIGNSPPVAVTAPRAGLQMVTPTRLAIDIMNERKLVVDSFVDWLETAGIEEKHIELQRELLTRSLDIPQVVAEPGWEALEAVYDASPEGDAEEEPGEDVESIWKPKGGGAQTPTNFT